jgi:hypothetical protein
MRGEPRACSDQLGHYDYLVNMVSRECDAVARVADCGGALRQRLLSLMRFPVVQMAMDMNMSRSIAMTVLMKVDAVAPQSPEHIGAKPDQHDADRCFERLSKTIWDRVT